MFEAEKEIPMRDDGLGDDTAEDGVWTAIIPTSINSAGWMLRYAVQGVDADGNTMRWPLFPNPRDSAAYLGLVIHDPSIQTKLPVVHLFAENPAWPTPILALEPLCFMTENFTTTSTSVFTVRALEVFQKKLQPGFQSGSSFCLPIECEACEGYPPDDAVGGQITGSKHPCL